MTFNELWFHPESCDAVAALVKRTEGLEGDVVEVGCWEGRSTIAIAQACAPAIVHAVDTWEGSDGEVSADLAAERDVFATFCSNTTGHNIVPHRMSWQTYFSTHQRPIRFLHIDGCHSFSEVHGNIAAALPFMVPGSVMCGDDVHHPPVQQAALRHFGAFDISATLWWVTL